MSYIVDSEEIGVTLVSSIIRNSEIDQDGQEIELTEASLAPTSYVDSSWV